VPVPVSRHLECSAYAERRPHCKGISATHQDNDSFNLTIQDDPSMLENFTIDNFRDRIGEAFPATPTLTPGRTLNLTLTSLDALPAPPDGGRVPFSLEFRDAATDHVPQQIIAVEHPEIGAFDLFVVPLGPGADGMRYEAIFT
jgi:hypothetical protein